MNFFFTTLGLFCGLSLVTYVHGIGCSRPAVGPYVRGVDGTECVALIKEKCTGMRRFTTHSWRRGIHVRSNCGKISSLTAIATFMGPGNRYDNGGSGKQHTAIFDGCDRQGIWVYDQWNGSGGVRRRRIPFSGAGTRNGASYYVINI